MSVRAREKRWSEFVQVSKLALFGIFFGIFSANPFSDASAADPKPPRRIALKKPKHSTKLQREFCTRLFSKEWEYSAGEITEAIPKNGFTFGVGSRMKMRVDGERDAEGIFLGRLIDSEFKTTDYMFKDFDGNKNYVIDADRCELKYKGAKVLDRELQAISSTFEQQGETCAVSSIVNYFTQLLASGQEGNGLLRKAFQTPEGYLEVQGTAYDYYLNTRSVGNFKQVFRKIGEKYGYICKSLETVQPAYLEKVALRILGQGIPVQLEFFIGPNMVNSVDQWVDTRLKVGEDRRFWAPRKRGQRSSSGHALVAVEMFTAESGRTKLLLEDSDWRKRPIEWDKEKYFTSRIKSSGMMAHYCVTKP